MSYDNFKEKIIEYYAQLERSHIKFQEENGNFVAIVYTPHNAPIKCTASKTSLRITVRWGATMKHCAQVSV